MDRDLAARDAAEDLAQRRQVEHVGQALAVGLDEDREAAVARRDREQVGGPLALLPERRPRPGRRRGRSSARAAFSRKRLANSADDADLPDDEVLDLVGVGEQQRLDAVERRVALGQADRDAVVGPDRLDLEPEPLAEPRLERQRPRRVDPAAERGQEARAASRRARRGSARRRSAGRSAGRPSPRARPRGRRAGSRPRARRGRASRAAARSAAARPFAPRARSASSSPTNAPSARPSSIGRPTASPFQNGSLPGTPGAGRDRDPVVADLLDPPAARAEDDDVAVHARPELVDHLLVELADAPAGRPGLADHEHAEQAAVRDRAAAGDRDDPRVAPALDDVGHPVPDDARLELGELVGRVGAGEHAEHALEDLAGERLVRRGAGDACASSSSTVQRSMTVIATSCWARTSSGLRGMRVVSIAPSCIRRVTTAHSSRSPRYFGKITPLLGRADLVAGPADPLEAAGDAGRALDLDDEVDRAHVDAELEAGRRDERREPAGLELLLDLEALLAGDAAVVGADELLAGELVEPLGEPLGRAGGCW